MEDGGWPKQLPRHPPSSILAFTLRLLQSPQVPFAVLEAGEPRAIPFGARLIDGYLRLAQLANRLVELIRLQIGHRPAPDVLARTLMRQVQRDGELHGIVIELRIVRIGNIGRKEAQHALVKPHGALEVVDVKLNMGKRKFHRTLLSLSRSRSRIASDRVDYHPRYELKTPLGRCRGPRPRRGNA